MMLAAKQQIILRAALHDDCNIIDVRTKEQKRLDELDLTDEEYEVIAEDSYDCLVHSLIEANGEIHELRSLLCRAYEHIVLLGFDSGFTNKELSELVYDISKYFKEIR